MNVHSVNRKARSRRAAKPVATRGRERDAAPVRGRGRPIVDDKRRRILDAALTCFAQRGYHGTTMPDVAVQADVGAGTLYRYFKDKEALVNEVYRDAKQKLRAALLDDAPAIDFYRRDTWENWFTEIWRRLGAFARSEPEAFRFLEMQDHSQYLDADSRKLEMSVLVPLLQAGNTLGSALGGTRVDILIALLWGAFVGVVKAQRLGYLSRDERTLQQAGAAAWRMIQPPPLRATERPKRG